MKYKFRAKTLNGEIVEGDLAYVTQNVFGKIKIVPYILKHRANGGMLYITNRYKVDENTIELIKND